MFNEMVKFFIKNKIISSSKSGFKPGDSCTNQLLSFTPEIYSPFEEVLEVRSFSLSILKAFDKVSTNISNFYTKSRIWLYFV